MELVVVYLAPIPVGHRVRVTWHVLEEPGLAGQVRTDTRPHQPWITDLDTGVEYRTDWASGAMRRRGPDEPYRIGESLRMDLREERVVEAVVRRCEVFTVRGYPELEVQTRLVLEPTS